MLFFLLLFTEKVKIQCSWHILRKYISNAPRDGGIPPPPLNATACNGLEGWMEQPGQVSKFEIFPPIFCDKISHHFGGGTGMDVLLLCQILRIWCATECVCEGKCNNNIVLSIYCVLCSDFLYKMGHYFLDIQYT